MRKIIMLLVLLLILIGCSQPKQQQTSNTPTQETKIETNVSDFKHLKISEINNLNPEEGEQFNTEGYVVRIYQCPPCPEEAEATCSPCPTNDFIVISEDNQLNNKILGQENLSRNELLVYTSEAGKFELGKEYKFSIKVLYSNHLNIDYTNDIELIDYEVKK